MKVFVTGGTGFIGKYVVRRLVEGGHSVRCLVRDTSRLNGLGRLGLEIIPGNVSSLSTLRTAMRGVDWVIHLAGLYTMWTPNPSAFQAVNVEGVCNVMQAALD
ncbi:MAG TPA: NAD-dependent epimerase/dehydratase family protein, partial [Anaerolineaceae bacterium]